MATFTPSESFDVLVNPGAGWCTMYSFNDDAKNRQCPRASIAYFRMFWDEYEPEEGRIRFDVIDHWLKRARENGQQLDLGFKPMGRLEKDISWHEEGFEPLVTGLPKPYRVPDWYFNLKPRGNWFRPAGAAPDSPPMWEPYYDDPLFLEKHGNLIRAIGRRYDGHPDLNRVDIGSVGAWGEWNCYGVPHPCWEARRILIDTYFDAFPSTLKTIVLGDKEALQYVLARGGGWAAHCLGDCRDEIRYEVMPWTNQGVHRVWNHMEDLYMQRICEVGGTRAWRKAPVMFESCWDMAHWHKVGWGADYIFSFALGMHASTINDKSKPVPDEWWPAVEDFSRKLGYRFVLREATCPDRIRAGHTAEATLRWENRGVAPCYRPYPVALRLKNTRTGRECIARSGEDIRRWFPGIHRHAVSLVLPDDFPTGQAELSVAILGIHEDAPAIRLANRGSSKDGWLALGGIAVDAAQ